MTSKSRQTAEVLNDLGTAAYLDKQTSPTDATTGRGLLVGAFGLGTDNIPYIGAGQDADTYIVSGVYYAGFSNGYGTGSAFLTVVASSGVRVKQVWRQANGVGVAERYKDGTWSVWQPVYTGANLNPNVFGGGSAIGRSSGTAARILLSWASQGKPSSLTVNGTFELLTMEGVNSGNFGVADVTLNTASSDERFVVLNLSNMVGLSGDKPYFFRAIGTSTITVNP